MADAEPLPPLPDNIATLTGPPFLGIFFNGFLLGILTLQYYHYCFKFRNDRTWLKVLVHIQFILETVQTAFSVADGFHWFVYGYGNLNRLGEFHLANIDSPILGSVMAVISQAVYCWRIYHLSHWKTPLVLIGLASACQVTGGFGIGIVNQQLGSIAKWKAKFNFFDIMWASGNAAADVQIAFVMTYLLLWSQRAPMRTANKRPPIVKRLSRAVIETNGATAFVAVVDLITLTLPAFAPPKTSLFLCPGYIFGKLYSNSFMAMLNSRSRSGNDNDAVMHKSFESRHETFSMQRPDEWSSAKQPPRMEPAYGKPGISPAYSPGYGTAIAVKVQKEIHASNSDYIDFTKP